MRGKWFLLLFAVLSACGTTDNPEGRIAISSDQDGDWEVLVVDMGTGLVEQITHNMAYDWRPVWSPDGSRLVFASDYLAGEAEPVEVSDAGEFQPATREKTGILGVVTLNADGSGRIRLTEEQATGEHPSWSPDGKRVVFVSYRTGNSEIFVMDSDGKNVRQLTDDPGDDWHPAWSADGSQIAFASTRTGDFELYVMDSEGGNVRQITESLETDWSPAWSPDGEKIAFASRRAGNWDVYLVNLDGGDARPLTDGPETDLAPVWSPDGRHLAFASDRSGTMGVYVMSADGTGVEPLGIVGIPSGWIHS